MDRKNKENEMKKNLLILVVLLNYFSQADAKPEFLNIEISGGGVIGRADTIEKLLYLADENKWHTFLKGSL